ncbi:hypothetical protein LMH87_001910 [Akanthomyces muscarius]|uniref:Alcohol acetyltransferase n=1 Tax=Akanthomyces muscarius TaxID=2231603 RepID=A0A9W8Q5T2_AKAMU|nr:hypothetical protein LMH87_001910 [Akanthomyces muscarius]KAJ4147388.1 hypothetical protein LMH87_001910 [Akanthomyces muscarius]
MTVKSDMTVLRPLGGLEMYFAARNHIGIYRAVVVTARYIGASLTNPGVDGRSVSPQFVSSLSAVVAAHPMLRVGILDESTSRASFVHVRSINIQDYISVVEVDCATEEGLNLELARLQASAHDEPWVDIESRPPWRIVIVRNKSEKLGISEDVLFSFHHSAVDGKSGMLFHESLLTELRARAGSKPQDSPEYILSFPKAPEIPEAQEDSVPFSFSPRFVAALLWKDLVPAMFKPAPQPVWSGKAISFSAPYITRILHLEIPAEHVAILRQACRAHKTTLTGLFHSLAFASLVASLPPEEAPAFSCGTPISLLKHRRDTQHDRFSRQETLRLLLSTLDHAISPAAVSRMQAALGANDESLGTEIWGAAGDIRGQLADRVDTLPRDDTAATVKFVRDFHAYWAVKDGKPRRNSWECSNIGAFTNPSGKGDQLHISRVMFSNGAPVAGAAIGVNVASVEGSGLTITLSWQRDIVEEKVMAKLKTTLEQLLKNFFDTGQWLI